MRLSRSIIGRRFRQTLRLHRDWRPQRRLKIESLETRCVLSGMVAGWDIEQHAAKEGDKGSSHEDEAVEVASYSEPPTTPSLTSFLVSAHQRKHDDRKSEESSKVEHRKDGVVHLHLDRHDREVVVRQFVDYRLRKTLEIEAGDRWLQFAEQDVKEVAIHQPQQKHVPVKIESGVDKHVRELDHDAVDRVFDDNRRDEQIERDEPEELDHSDQWDRSEGERDGEDLIGPRRPASSAMIVPMLAAPPLGPGAGGAAGPEGEGGEGDPGSGGNPLMPPQIVDFSAVQELNVWLISGHVLDDKDPAGLTVVFGGLFAGETDTVDSEGYFEQSLILPLDAVGIATAQVTDRDNLTSELAEVLIG